MQTPPYSPGDKANIDIIDIRSSTHESSLKTHLKTALSANPPTFPSLLLWDEKGLQYFEAITYADEYYLTNCEIELLRQHSDEIARQIEPGSVLVELGSGCLRKIKLLLDALEAQFKPVDYFALDLSHSELQRTLAQISPSAFSYVRCHGLLGTYDDGLRWLKDSSLAERPKCVLSLGSTLGSSSRSEAAAFLSRFAGATRTAKQKALFIVGVDGCKDGQKVWHAYNDKDNCNQRFITNILENSNRTLGYDAFKHEDWGVEGKWNSEEGRHEQYLVPVTDVTAEGLSFEEGSSVLVVSSHKYDEKEQEKLWEDAGLQLDICWRTEPHQYSEFILYSVPIRLLN